jgi:hypothetical protein
MIQKLKNILMSLAAAVALVAPVALTVPAVYADANIAGSLCTGTDFEINANGGSASSCKGNAGTDGLNKLLVQVVNIFSGVVGVVAVLMIIIGGFRYITSGGDSNKVGTAKNTLIYAIIGLVIVTLSQIIVRFVLQKANSI